MDPGKRFVPLLAAVLLALSAPAAVSQCAEPSALDLDSTAPPLTVQKEGSELRISWEDVAADGFRLHRGSLARLHDGGGYDHRVVAESPTPTLLHDAAAGSLYFLVNSDCRGGDSGVGRDSSGVERPWGGRAVVTVGIQGGSGVNALQFLLTHPRDRTFTERGWARFAGPFASGAPGSPFGIVNVNVPGEVRMGVVFGVFDPDPSFDPPAGTPIDVAEVEFGYHGAAPSGADFEVLDCVVIDSLGNAIPETQCLLSGLDVLF